MTARLLHVHGDVESSATEVQMDSVCTWYCNSLAECIGLVYICLPGCLCMWSNHMIVSAHVESEQCMSTKSASMFIALVDVMLSMSYRHVAVLHEDSIEKCNEGVPICMHVDGTCSESAAGPWLPPSCAQQEDLPVPADTDQDVTDRRQAASTSIAVLKMSSQEDFRQIVAYTTL